MPFPEVAKVIQDLDDITRRAELAIAELMAQRDEIDTQLRRLRSITRITAPSQPIPQRRSTKPKGTPRGQVMAKVAQTILSAYGPEGEFTAMELHHKKLDDPWTESHTYQVLNQLREIEFIGKAGRIKVNGAMRDVFKVLDAHAADSLLAKAASNGKA